MKFARLAGWCFLLNLLVFASLSQAQPLSGKRVALVIGNGAYEHTTALPNPANDARAMAAKLRGFGFEVIEAADRDYRGMRQALRDFEQAMTGASAGLFFYAGHGMEYQGRNYIFPTDAVLETEGDIGFGLVDMGQVLRIMETSVPTRLVFLDACRNNPLARSFRSVLGTGTRAADVGTGLAQMDAGHGTFISYATAPGNVAEDGVTENSPFTTALLEHLGEPGMDVRLVMDKVRRSVLEATSQRQTPWESSSLLGSFVFNQEIEAAIEAMPTASVSAPKLIAPADTLWAALQGSTRADEWLYFSEAFASDPRSALAQLRAQAFQADTNDVLASASIAPRVALDAGPQSDDPVSIEIKLALDQSAWQRIQSALQSLSFDPKGVDGQPGANTRTAIMKWQHSQGFRVSGYLDERQYALLTNESGLKLAALPIPSPPQSTTQAIQPVVGLVQHYQPGDIFKDCETCPAMVVVPSGDFSMGSPSSENGRSDHESPPHRVSIAEPFAVGIFEVTFAEWDACLASGGCDGYRPEDEGQGRGQYPVTFVSWQDAQAYVTWLSQVTGQNYRLLSEAEWEYVARAKTTARRFWGNDEDEQEACNYANGNDLSSKRANRFTWASWLCDDGYAKAAPVGSYNPNGFGLHDVIGNVWEWVEDCSNKNYNGAPSDSSAWTSGDCNQRMRRGGSWRSSPKNLRAATRSGDLFESRSVNLGFRVARDLL